MSNRSPHPNSPSPHTSSSSSNKKPYPSAFVWPIPSSPSQPKPTKYTMNELTVREILDRYNEDPELLKYILTAKSEEDKKKAAKDTLRAEEARIQLRQMDLDLAREQTKASARYERMSHPVTTAYVQTPQVQHPHHHAPPPPPPPPPSLPSQAQAQAQTQQPQSAYHPSQYGPYYGLSPVQQQVLARFHHPVQHGNHHQPPPSPSVPYPHSAHPLCPPSSNEDRSRLQFRQKSPSSPIGGGGGGDDSNNSKKRNRSSLSSPNENVNESQTQQQQDKLSHNKVMEALKAKIQRGNGGPPSPLTASPMRSLNQQQQSQENMNKKRKPTLPRPVVIHQQIVEGSSPSPSPRSAKPVLPPIDTNLGRIDKSSISSSNTTTTSNSKVMVGNNVESSTSESSTTTTATTTSSSSKSNNSAESIKQSQQQPQEATSPSDHILLNTRRARSLSPSSVAKKA